MNTHRAYLAETAAVEHRRVADTFDMDDWKATSVLLRDLMHYADWLHFDFNDALTVAQLEFAIEKRSAGHE